MGEEVRISEHGDGEEAGGDEARVSEWVNGLPSGDDLTPLSQSLVPSILAVAFSIIPEQTRTIQDVNRASQNTLSSLRSIGSSGAYASSSNTAVVVDEVDRAGSSSPGTDLKKQKKSDGGEATVAETVDSMTEEGDSETEDPSGKTLKRPRLVWTPQLHKRFVEVVAHLGIKNAVPKTIMQLMNVEGLTREKVASHLQKYRLYLKRIQGLPTGGTSSEDQMPVPPQSFKDGGGSNAPANRTPGKIGISIPIPSMMPMPVYGHHMGMQGYHQNHDSYHHNSNGVFESNPYMMQQNKFESMATSPSVGGGGVIDK